MVAFNFAFGINIKASNIHSYKTTLKFSTHDTLKKVDSLKAKRFERKDSLEIISNQKYDSTLNSIPFEQIPFSKHDSLFNFHDKDSLKSLKFERKKFKTVEDTMPYFSPNFADSLKAKSKIGLIDKIKKVKLLSRPSGIVSLGYLYGTHPFLGDQKNFGAIQSEGKLDLTVANLPLKAEYFIMNPSSNFGPRNYYKISIDQEKFNKNIAKSNFNAERIIKQRLDSLKNEKLNLKQQKSLLENQIEFEKYNKKNITTSKLQGLNNGLSLNSELPDSLGHMLNFGQDSLLNFNADSTVQNKVSDNNKINKYKGKLEELNALLNNIESAENLYQSKLKSIQENKKEGISNEGKSKFNKHLGHLKKLNIGLSYPDYSTFLVKGAISGIDLNYKGNGYFFDFTSGKFQHNLINTRINSNSRILNKILGNENDSNIRQIDKRFLIISRVGIGEANGNHISISVLQGWKKYIDAENVNSRPFLRNLVYELRSNYTYKKFNISGAFAKSQIYVSETVINDETKEKKLFLNNSAAELKLKINNILPRIDFKSSIKRIGKDYESFGLLTIRRNTLKYEAGFDWKLTKKLKYSVVYRKETDMQLEELGIQTELKQIKNTIQWKLLKNSMLVAYVSPIIHTMDSLSKKKIISENWLAGLTLVNKFKINKQEWLNTSSYNYTSLHYNDTALIMGTFTFQQNIPVNKNISINLNVIKLWYPNQIIEQPWFIQTDLAAKIGKKIKGSLGGSLKIIEKELINYGVKTRIQYNINSTTDFEVFGEKVLIGDYYAFLPQNMIDNFPWNAGFKIIKKI